MHSTPADILRDRFGYDAFRPTQEAVIDQVTGGGDALVIMPTGGGKSLCYQIPAVVRNGCRHRGLSAHRADAGPGFSALQQNGVDAAFLNSTLDPAEAASDRWKSATEGSGPSTLLYVAPERLMMPRTLEILAAAPRSALFAIDEAHCVLPVGSRFPAEYLQLIGPPRAVPRPFRGLP